MPNKDVVSWKMHIITATNLREAEHAHSSVIVLPACWIPDTKD